MKVSSTAVFMAAAMGAMAHPNFLLRHRSVAHVAHVKSYHAPPPQDDAKNVANVPAASSSSAPPPPSNPSPAPVQSSQQASPKKQGSTGQGPTSFKDFCGRTKRATIADIVSTGNVGTDSDFGCNLMLVSSDIVKQYPYSITFVTHTQDEYKCACWNKMGRDRKPNSGHFLGQEVFQFTIPPGGKQGLAIDANSQGACVCNATALPVFQQTGMFQGSWIEFDFGSERNDDVATKAKELYNGFDASCLTAVDSNAINIPGLMTCLSNDPKSCSTVLPGCVQGGRGYVKGMNALDGISVDTLGTNVHIIAILDYHTGVDVSPFFLPSTPVTDS
ncbi:hypothetical protein DCS_03119 [Drechmeria coniospora]|uniref:Allergen Asp F4-like protein n=1 Tax=Drechmeria coniospora TaxID=98403 RepID=A0A151GXZ5_DRECN|nr:hypothetical protein DCS_03119 [Drechmeria coniospora]KYK61974.1 hypothetical protein DCS_03119 [Drechmeria coniospora]